MIDRYRLEHIFNVVIRIDNALIGVRVEEMIEKVVGR